MYLFLILREHRLCCTSKRYFTGSSLIDRTRDIWSQFVSFSDDLGVPEEPVDLGRWSFLRLLIEALCLSPMFEGKLDNTGIYWFQVDIRCCTLNNHLSISLLYDQFLSSISYGRSVTLSLLRAMRENRQSKPCTLFSCFVDGPDSDLKNLEKLKRYNWFPSWWICYVITTISFHSHELGPSFFVCFLFAG